MASRLFSWKVLWLGLGLLGAVACSDDAPAPCPGVERDGKCYAICDEALDCKSDPNRKCVRTDRRPEGFCASSCADDVQCGAGSVCRSTDSIKGEKVAVCVDRAEINLPAGKAGDACADDVGCDTATGLICAEGKCARPAGAACTGNECAAGLACVEGKCARPAGAACTVDDCAAGLSCVEGKCARPAGAACTVDDCASGLSCVEGKCARAAGAACTGNDCAPGFACVEGKCARPAGAACTGNDCAPGLACFQGSCQTVTAMAGEACAAERPCVAGELVCLSGTCRYGCQTLGGCAEGYECRTLSAPVDGFNGGCVKLADGAPGHYGTSCPKGTECDKDAGFVCVGPNGLPSSFCTKRDGCQQDADCPSGYWCGQKLEALDTKGNVDFDNPVRVCLQRQFCAPCETDFDCGFEQGSICVPDADGEKFCSQPCNKAKNSCLIGAACVDVGDGRTACRPDTGSCHSKEGPTGCEPCRIDSDCGPGALCREGQVGFKPSLRWCQVPCGAPDADGKRPCPLAPNGQEMICLDEHLLSLGGPISSEEPNSVYGMCYQPFTVDNTSSSSKDPLTNACNNGKREGAEECDDGNSTSGDGCDKCKITTDCRFTLTTDDQGVSTLHQADQVLKEIPTTCRSFLIEGTLVKAGEVAQFRFNLNNGDYSWFDVFSGGLNQCGTDLLASVRTGAYDEATDTVDITDKNGQLTACEKLSATIKNLDAKTPTLCKDGALGCGSCDDKGLCGQCDDDSGVNNCPRMLLSSTLDVQGYKVKFASTKQVARLNAASPTATNVPFTVIVDRLTAGVQGPKNSPALSCY